MEIYVLSAGVSQQQDYIWQHITKTAQKQVDEPILVKNFKSLLDTQALSIFIGRESNKLILFVTGMKASKRKDYRNRTIRNSIALIAPDNRDSEQKIRGIAVLALSGNLENEIDSAIKEGGEWGYEVDYQKIDNIIKVSSQTNNSTATRHLMTGKNTVSNRQNIADELKTSCLPEKTNDSEVLIVVTGIKAEDALKQAEVWRGLSKLVDKEQLTKYEKANSVENFLSNNRRSRKAIPKFAIRLIIFLGLTGVIILYFWSQNFFNSRTPIVIKLTNPTTVSLAAISPGGEYIASANLNGQLVVQNTQNKNKDIIDNNTPVKSIAISPDGKYVVTGKQNGEVQLWNIPKKKEVKIKFEDGCKKDTTEVLALDFNASKQENNVSKQENRDELEIVSGHADGKVLIWNIDVENDKSKGCIEELGANEDVPSQTIKTQ